MSVELIIENSETSEFIINPEVSIMVDAEDREVSVVRSQDDETEPGILYDETGWHLEVLSLFSIEKEVSKEHILQFCQIAGLFIHEDPTPV